MGRSIPQIALRPGATMLSKVRIECRLYAVYKGNRMSIKNTSLPKTDSIQELAKFWDSHDITDFDEQLELAVERFEH